MEHPELSLLIHKSRRQHDTKHPTPASSLPSQPGPISSLRTIAGNALITLGTRVTPAPRPATPRRSVLNAPISASTGK